MGIKCFVGHVFDKERIDDLRDAIKEGFGAAGATTGIEFWYADDYISSDHILDKIFKAIQDADFCIFEVSESTKPNVFLELGFAYGRGKQPFLLLKSGHRLPSDLAGRDYVSYRSMTELTEKIQKFATQFLTPGVINEIRRGERIPMNRKVVREAVKLKAGDVYDVSTIFQKAYGSSRISKEENHRLQMMIRFDLLEKAGNGLRLTKKGYKFLHDAAEVDKIFEASGSAISEAPDIAIPIT